MKNKYRINTDWSPDGKDKPPRNDNPSIYRVIIDIIDELNKSLEIKMMEESKNDEEVRKILDNPEGITIEELQIIDVWEIDKKLRREVRRKLDFAYRYLSAELAYLIATRNDMENKGIEKSNEIDIENGKLKNTIVNQHKVIEKQVQSYKQKGEISEKERKLLVYIRKVYLEALSETIERIFLTAPKSTKRVEIFPRDEQRRILNEISDLKDEISSLTWKSKQKQKEQQKNKVNEEALKKSLKQPQQQLPEVDEESRIVEKLNGLINRIEVETSQGALGRAETRACLKEVRDGLKRTVAELKKEVDSSRGYQSLQVQLPKK